MNLSLLLQEHLALQEEVNMLKGSKGEARGLSVTGNFYTVKFYFII